VHLDGMCRVRVTQRALARDRLQLDRAQLALRDLVKARDGILRGGAGRRW
jgi:hypothetical protein